jgi:hypothetical protein
MKRKSIGFTLVSLMIILSALPFMNNTKSVQAASIAWTDPATVKLVDDALLSTLIDARADGSTRITETINGVSRNYTPLRETYSPADRQWQGLPSTVRTGNRLWTTWYTGGSGEPRQLNYLVVAYSDDNGETWVDPYLIVDHDDANHVGVSLGVPNFWMDDDTLCLTYIQYFTWVIKFHNPDTANIGDVIIDEPIKFTNSKLHKGPTILKDSDGSTIFAVASEHEAGDAHLETTRIYISKNRGATWGLHRSQVNSSVPANRKYPESQIVDLKDGKWMIVSRIENGAAGGIETSISEDYGYTWQPYQNNLSEPFIGPGSKTHVMRLSSGNILMINHDKKSSRASLCAYLSVDEGTTWPYKFRIDQRDDVTYPSAFEKDGLIYVAWDKGRYIEKEVRLSMITEADIMAGYVVSTNSKEKIIVSKLNVNYTEIVSVNDAFLNKLTYPVGTPSSVIRESLPTTFMVTDNDGNTTTGTGTWKSSGYKQDVAGTYLFTFSTSLPATLSDTYNMLSTRVHLIETNPTINLALVLPIAIGGSLAIGAGATLLIKRKKKNAAKK